MAKDIAGWLMFSSEMQDVIIVGISYDQGNDVWWSKRSRDYIPTKDTISDFGKQWPLAGGASHFIDFIRKELFPAIEQRYSVLENNRGIIGFSFGGLLSSYILLNHSDLFDNYIIISPGLVWDNAYILQIEKKYSENHTDLDKRLFIALSSEESKEWIIRPTICFIEALKTRAYPNLELIYEYYEGETHFTGYPRALTDGLKQLYGKQQ